MLILFHMPEGSWVDFFLLSDFWLGLDRNSRKSHSANREDNCQSKCHWNVACVSHYQSRVHLTSFCSVLVSSTGVRWWTPMRMMMITKLKWELWNKPRHLERICFTETDTIFDLFAESWDATRTSVCLWKPHHTELILWHHGWGVG